jgi:hypothetical protein
MSETVTSLTRAADPAASRSDRSRWIALAVLRPEAAAQADVEPEEQPAEPEPAYSEAA